MSYRESQAFRASRAKTARKRYWRNPEKERQRCRDYRRKTKMTEAKDYPFIEMAQQAEKLVAQGHTIFQKFT